MMISIKPKDDEDTKIFRRLIKDQRFYTDDVSIPRNLGRRYPQLFDEGYLDIGRIKKKRESIIATRPNVGIVPIQGSATRTKMKFKFYKIF